MQWQGQTHHSLTVSCLAEQAGLVSDAQVTTNCGGGHAGKQLSVRPVLEASNSDTHGWSLGASDGDHSVRLDAMDEGLTRLVASLPSDNAESQGMRTSSGCSGKPRLSDVEDFPPCI